MDPVNRITAEQALSDVWVRERGSLLASKNLGPSLARFVVSNAKRKFKHAVVCVVFILCG